MPREFDEDYTEMDWAIVLVLVLTILACVGVVAVRVLIGG